MIHLVSYREISLVILTQLTFQVQAKAPYEVIAVHTNMPGLTTEPSFKHITIKELHPTFGAEISGIDFSKPVDDDVFQEVLAAITKVSTYTIPTAQILNNDTSPTCRKNPQC